MTDTLVPISWTKNQNGNYRGHTATWTVERLQQLADMFHAGATFSAIAGFLGVSRNAAIGKARRIGLTRPHSQSEKVVRVKPKPAISVLPKPKSVLAERPLLEPLAANDGPVTIATVRRDQCQWIEDAEPRADSPMCGRQAKDSWCEHHRKIVFSPFKGGRL